MPSRRSVKTQWPACLPDLPAGDGGSGAFPAVFYRNIDNLMAKHGVSDEHIVMRVQAARTVVVARCWRKWVWWGSAGSLQPASWRQPHWDTYPTMYKENITESEILASLDELIGAGRKSAKRVKASATLRCVRDHSPGARSGARFVGLTISPVCRPDKMCKRCIRQGKQ